MSSSHLSSNTDLELSHAHAWICLPSAVLPKAAGVWKWRPWGSWGGLWWSCGTEVPTGWLFPWGYTHLCSPPWPPIIIIIISTQPPALLPAGHKGHHGLSPHNHRVTHWVGLEVTLEIIHIQLPAMGTSWMLRAPPSYFMGLKKSHKPGTEPPCVGLTHSASSFQSLQVFLVETWSLVLGLWSVSQYCIQEIESITFTPLHLLIIAFHFESRWDWKLIPGNSHWKFPSLFFSQS